MKFLEEAKLIEPYLVETRRYFHTNPELSWKENNTQSYIMKELDDMGIPYEPVCKTGICATIKGNKEKPVIGIRADMDALPIQEETGLPFSSINDGVMHACGHDSHMAMLLGTAKLLLKHKNELECTVKLLFQPAEEYIMDSGAKYMAVDECVSDIDNIVGAHIWSYLDEGKISVEAGPRLSSADTFKIEIIGKSGHGAMPECSIDPVVCASSVVMNMQSLASREMPPAETFVCSITSLRSGTTANVIPERAILEGTTRTFNSELRNTFKEKMERIIKGTCEVYRAKYVFEYYPGTPPTVNEVESSKVAEQSVIEALGEDALVKFDPTMVGEDFSKLLNKIPGCFALVGARNIAEGKNNPHHNAHFDIDENAMKNGVAFFTQYVFNMQKKLRK